MIAHDTSDIVAIVSNDVRGGDLRRGDRAERRRRGAPTLLEVHMVLSRKHQGGVGDSFERLSSNARVEPVDVSASRFRLAQNAFDRYDSGGNAKASLNVRDCLSYPVAEHQAAPLPFNFRQTDLRSAL